MSDSPIKKKHFAKLHEKIQNKYFEMQKKMEKSKSIDALTTVSDDYLHKDYPRVASVSDLRDETFNSDNTNSDSEQNNSIMQSIIVENVYRQDVTYTEIDYKEASVSEFQSGSVANVNEIEISEGPLANELSFSSES